MQRNPYRASAGVVLVLLGSSLGGCGGDSYLASYTDAPSDYGTYTGGDDDDDGPPPEVEDDLLQLPPAQTDDHVFVVNPERDTLTRIDVRTHAVDTIPVGSRPEIVQTTPDHQRAVVLDRGDDAVTIVDVDTMTQRTVPIRDDLNTMAISPDSAWAVLWHDSAREDDFVPEGLQSFNEASFVELETGTHFPMAVGFDPKEVLFTPDGALAVVVSDDQLAKVDLSKRPLLPDLIDLAPGDLDPPSAEEAILAADGSFAWVRQFGATHLLVVDLESGTVSEVDAGDNPTDLDLSPDGRTAVAVARDSSELWVYDASDPFASPTVVPLPDSGYGSLLFAPVGDRAVVYTTATRTERYGVWRLKSDEVIERSLVKPVASMAITPTGGSLMVFHTLGDGPSTDPEFAGHHAVTLVDLDDLNRTNPILLPAEPLSYANSTTGRLGYLVMKDDPYLAIFDHVTLLHEQALLPSLPLFLGVLPDADPEDDDEPPAWISQDHPLGRISFFDPDDASLETLTGFELNSGIEDGD